MTAPGMTLGIAAVQEYQSLSFWGRLRYRTYRHPLVMFGGHAAYAASEPPLRAPRALGRRSASPRFISARAVPRAAETLLGLAGPW
jgi:hypothetical protein